MLQLSLQGLMKEIAFNEVKATEAEEEEVDRKGGG
jgi:hypothetical protein